MVNASKIDEDFAWLQSHLPAPDAEGDIRIELANRSDRFAALAVQGPRAPEIFAAFFGPDAPLPERFGVRVLERDGLTFLVARTGYTGEDGFEWFFPARASEVVWDELLATGARAGSDPLRPRLARQPAAGGLLPAQRLRPLAQAHPAGRRAGHFRRPGKTGGFIGRDALLAAKGRGRPRRTARGLPHDGQMPAAAPALRGVRRGRRGPIGETTSGGLSPSLEAGIGMAYLPAKFAKAGTPIEIDIRGKRYAAVIEKKPLYKRRDERLHPGRRQGLTIILLPLHSSCLFSAPPR